jgi:hypothetical protein
VTLEPGTYEAGLEVFRNLRAEDEWELSRLGDTGSVLAELVGGSDCTVARVDGAPSCIFGVRPGRGGVDSAKLWLVTTPLVERKWAHLARMGYDFVQQELRKHGVLECWVLCRNARAVRWLEWMGFHGELEELPALGQVIRFEKRL